MAAYKRIVLPQPREQTADRQVNKLQENAAQAAKAVNAIPFAVGHHVENVAIAAGGPNRVAHGLGRKVRGFIETSSTFPDKVYRSDPSTADDDKHIDLTVALVGGTCSLWFF